MPATQGSFAHLEAKIRRDAHGTVFGRDFEWICQWYLEHAPVYRGKFRKVWRWADWPDRWGPDCGVDLVAETHDGKLWAIQAKAVAADRSITKAEIDSFLSESNRRQIAYRLLIATTDDLGTNARRTIDQQAKRVSFVGRGDLLAADVVWPTKVSGTAPRPKRAKPRPYQRAAVTATLRGFRRHTRGRLIMACGTGKTLTGLWVHERLKSRRTLLLVPSISLVQQNLREWGRHARWDFDCLVVCSDESVASDRNDPALRYIAELGIDVTTDPAEIAAFLAKRRLRPAVVIATYQSSDRVSKGQQKARKPFDLALCDEAHRLVGEMRGKFATVLDDRKIRSRRRLFMTATPRYFSRRAKERAADQDLEVASMDDVETFGPEFHVLKFYDAITARPTPLLTDYRVVVIGVTSAEAAAWVAEGKLVRTRDGAETDARTLAAQIGLAKAIRKYDLRRIITFHRSIRRASRFVDSDRRDSLPSVVDKLRPAARPSGKLWARHISGETPASKRASMLRALAELPADTRGLISNCACLGEGVDVPALDGIAFIDPKGSVVDIIQAVGRVIRKSEDKTKGTIVIPVFVDESADEDHALEQSAFDPVWQVLKALRAHDQRLADELDTLRTSIGKDRGGRVTLPKNVILDVPTLALKDFEKAFCVRAIQATSPLTFAEWIGICSQWCTQTQQPLALATADTKHRGYRIGDWISRQRVSYRTHRLTPPQIRSLEQLGIAWKKKRSPDESWRFWVNLCDEWRKRHGTLSAVPQGGVFKGMPLGKWLMKQRGKYRRGLLSKEQIAVLVDRGAVWQPNDEKFRRGLAACDAWIAQGNTLGNVGRKTIVDGFAFAKWISVQRDLYRRGTLSDGRRRLLETRGMVWDPGVAKDAARREILQRYTKRHGSLANVRQGEVFEGVSIGTMLSHRRRFYRAGTLDENERTFLEGLGLVWEPLHAERASVIRLLEAFKKSRGGFLALTNKTVIDNVRVGATVARWRARYRQGNLDPFIRSECRRVGLELSGPKKRDGPRK